VQSKVISFDNRFTALDLKNNTARLQNRVVVEITQNFLWLIPMSAKEDILADEEIAVKDPDLIAMKGSQVLMLNGQNFASMSFHGDFRRVTAEAKF
jgi:hypothetical protein